MSIYQIKKIEAESAKVGYGHYNGVKANECFGGWWKRWDVK